MIFCDTSKTRERKKELIKYYRQSVYSTYGGKRKDRCNNLADCKNSGRSRNYDFIPFQLSGIGNYYDLKIDNRDIRIVVSGYEFGDSDHVRNSSKYYPTKKPKGYVSVNECNDMINENAEDVPGKRWNKIMDGSALLLKELFSTDGEELSANGEKCHVFDCFSFVNMLLCSRCGPKRQSRRTVEMIRNCSWHYIKAMEILEPTILFILGKGNPGFETIKEHLNEQPGCQCEWEPIDKKGDIRKFYWEDDNRGKSLAFITCQFYQPAIRDKNKWYKQEHDYFKKIVCRAIDTLREMKNF